MRAIRLEEGRRVCGAVSQSRTSGGRRPPLSLSTLSLSLIIIIIHDRRRPAVSPRLAKSIDMFSVACKPGHVDHGTLSVHDAFASDFESFFLPATCKQHFIKYCTDVALRPDVSAKTVEAQALKKADAAPARAASFSLFAPPKGALKPYEFGADGSSRTARADEKSTIATWASELVGFMSSDIREKFFPGRASVPAEVYPNLLLEAVKNSGGAEYLRSCVYALRRFDEWLKAKISVCHCFDVKPAVVAWFLLNNRVADEDDGHASQSLVSGLRFAADTLAFPFTVSTKSLRAIGKPPTRTPKQAPSASLRIVYHFFTVACCTSHSMVLRGMSACFSS